MEKYTNKMSESCWIYSSVATYQSHLGYMIIYCLSIFPGDSNLKDRTKKDKQTIQLLKVLKGLPY